MCVFEPVGSVMVGSVVNVARGAMSNRFVVVSIRDLFGNA